METFEEIKNKIKNCCVENEAPYCTALCPFRLDMHEFISNVRRGSFSLAYRDYSNKVGFPSIISEVCKAPCKAKCPMGKAGGAISLDLLEKSCVDFASNIKPYNFNLPAKKAKIAVIGAGISGLACTLRLANKKYSVTVFEKSGRIGGDLWNLLKPEIFLEEFDRQFMYEKYDLALNSAVSDINILLKDFQAVYVATGKGGDSFGLLDGAAVDGVPFATAEKGVFLGGSLMGSDAAGAAAEGLTAANTLEFYIKTGNMKSAPVAPESRIIIDDSVVKHIDHVPPANGGRYTKDEAKAEAKRCIDCRCDICRRMCPLMTYFELMPKRIEGEVHITIHPGTLDGNGTVATRLISTCSQCGLCGEVCPEHIDMGMFLRLSHNQMRDKGAMPWAYHEFWLRDMDFADSDKAAFSYQPVSAGQKSRYMFFPGCQLGASNPEYVTKSYEYLLERFPDTAICLRCCGAPAAWSGDHEIHDRLLEEIKEVWRGFGEPEVVFACQSCRKFFADYLPEIKGVSLYEVMAQCGTSVSSDGEKDVSVFDPCSARYFPKAREAVRSLVSRSGYHTHPLKYEGDTAQCCSWGGQISIANRGYSEWLAESRIHDGDLPYIVYCSNCRDIFAGRRKQVRHILDVVFGLSGWEAGTPTFTQRQINREHLRAWLALKYKSEKTEEAEKMKLYIDPEVESVLDSRRILDDNVRHVIEYCEKKQRSVTNAENGHKFGYTFIGQMTCWAEYMAENDGYRVFNAYTHRMKIELEEVWNGRKQNKDDLQ